MDENEKLEGIKEEELENYLRRLRERKSVVKRNRRSVSNGKEPVVQLNTRISKAERDMLNEAAEAEGLQLGSFILALYLRRPLSKETEKRRTDDAAKYT